jgi:hypothetical protein
MKTRQPRISRRTFLTGAGAAAVGFGIARTSGTAFASETLPELPWPYAAGGLDPDDVRKRAFCLDGQGGCGHGGGQALVDALALAVGYPWTELPNGLYRYAGGGVGWGTICGALNGVIAVMGILGVNGKLGNALMEYYSTADLPTDALEGWVPCHPDYDNCSCAADGLPEVVTSVSGSPLCHVSVSTWAAAQGVTVKDPLKKVRCGRLVGDIAYKAVLLMNDYLVNDLAPAPWEPAPEYADCYTCHTPGSETVPSQHGKMDCLECHDTSATHGVGSWKQKGKK